jgi:hypothetical protein
VSEADDEGTVADGARDPLRRAGADVTGREDTWADGLEHVRFAVGKRPAQVAGAGSRDFAAQQVAGGVDGEDASDASVQGSAPIIT